MAVTDFRRSPAPRGTKKFWVLFLLLALLIGGALGFFISGMAADNRQNGAFDQQFKRYASLAEDELRACAECTKSQEGYAHPPAYYKNRAALAAANMEDYASLLDIPGYTALNSLKYFLIDSEHLDDERILGLLQQIRAIKNDPYDPASYESLSKIFS